MKLTTKALKLNQLSNQKVALKRAKKLLALLEDESRLEDLLARDWLEAHQSASGLLGLLAETESKASKM